MAHHHTGGHPRIGRNGFVAGVASYDSLGWMAHYASQHQGSGRITVLRRELCEARGIAVGNGAGRDAVNEIALSKWLVGKRTWECRSARCD